MIAASFGIEPPNQIAAPYTVEVIMLAALPIVFACYGVQPCQPAAILQPSIRSSSPAAIVSHAMPRAALTDDGTGSLSLAGQQVAIPPASTLPQRGRTQVAVPRRTSTGATKAMLVVAGAIAGCYAGAYLGEAMEENGWAPGMTIGAVLGGWMAWTLVK